MHFNFTRTLMLKWLVPLIFVCMLTSSADMPTIDAMLELLMEKQSHFTPLFRQYLKEQTAYKALNFDQWSSFLEFTLCVRKDLLGYDPEGACNFSKWTFLITLRASTAGRFCSMVPTCKQKDVKSVIILIIIKILYVHRIHYLLSLKYITIAQWFTSLFGYHGSLALL